MRFLFRGLLFFTLLNQMRERERDDGYSIDGIIDIKVGDWIIRREGCRMGMQRESMEGEKDASAISRAVTVKSQGRNFHKIKEIFRHWFQEKDSPKSRNTNSLYTRHVFESMYIEGGPVSNRNRIVSDFLCKGVEQHLSNRGKISFSAENLGPVQGSPRTSRAGSARNGRLSSANFAYDSAKRSASRSFPIAISAIRQSPRQGLYASRVQSDYHCAQFASASRTRSILTGKQTFQFFHVNWAKISANRSFGLAQATWKIRRYLSS